MTVVVQWTEVTQLERNAALLFPESVRVSTRTGEHFFSMFLNISDTFKLMEQLANLAMRQLLDNEAFAADRSLPKPRKALKNVSVLKRCGESRTAPAPARLPSACPVGSAVAAIGIAGRPGPLSRWCVWSTGIWTPGPRTSVTGAPSA